MKESFSSVQAHSGYKERIMATKALTESNFQETVKSGIVLVDSATAEAR